MEVTPSAVVETIFLNHFLGERQLVIMDLCKLSEPHSKAPRVIVFMILI